MKKGLIATITVVAFVAVAMIFSTAMVQQASAAAPAADAPDTVEIHSSVYTKYKQGPVEFSHKEHSETYKVKCAQCHHTWKEGEPVKKCEDCHKEKKEGKTPKLEKAFHDNCKDCHKAYNKAQGSKDAPTACKDCHAKK